MAYTVFGAVGAALIARKIGGGVAGLISLALILFSPLLLKPSRAVLGEFHAVAWSVWSVWAILRYQESANLRQRWLFLILSALALAASLLTKLLSPFIVVLILLVIAAQHKAALLNWPPRLKHFLLEASAWSLALVLPVVLLLFVIFDAGPLFRQVVDQRLLARSAYLAEVDRWPPLYEYTLDFIQHDWLLIVSAIIGLIVTWRRCRPYALLLAAWLLLAALFLVIHTPLRDKHFLILIPELAILGGLAVAAWLAPLAQWRYRPASLENRRPTVDPFDKLRAGRRPIRQAQGRPPKDFHPLVMYGVRDGSKENTGYWGWRGFSLSSLAGLMLWGCLSLYQIPTLLAYHHDDSSDLPTPSDEEQQMLAFIEEVTTPEDCIITDNTPLLYWSGRMTPPELAEMSGNRLISGELSVEELIAVSERYDCPVIAAVDHRIVDYLPDYFYWVASHYLGRVYYQEIPLFFAKIDLEPRPAIPLRANFDGKLFFHGYSLPAQPVTAGERIPLRFVWERQTQLETDYAIFVQLRDDLGNTLANADYQPYESLLPLSGWPEGQPLETLTWLVLPPDLKAGEYAIYTGLYRLDTLERLPLRSDASGENALILGPLSVE